MTFGRPDLLRWIYLGRLAVVSGAMVGALVTWSADRPTDALLATLMFGAGVAVTAVSLWHTELRRRPPGEAFCYAQVVTDVLLATGLIHITGGAASSFTFLYVMAIAEGALLLPLPGGVLIGALASVLYVADIFWFHVGEMTYTVFYQVALFALMALATGFLGDRLRRAGLAVGAVESELRQLRLDTGEILAQLGTGVLTVEGDGRLAYLNPAGEELLGLSSDQWLGAPVVRKVEEVAPGMGIVLRRALGERVSTSRFKTLAFRNGEERVLGVSTAVLQRPDGSDPSATAIFQDITDLDRVEALSRRTERLEAVAELSASLAHEIKNPLASIRSAVEQLGRGTLGGDDRAVLERLVLNESDRLSRLLSEFLEFTGLRMGRSEKVDLAKVVRECVDVVRQHPDAADGVTFAVHGADGPCPLPGDEDLLHRSVFNLLLNAAQFSAPQGTVRLRLDRPGRAVPREAAGVPEPVRLSIRDTGPGVDDEEKARIFDPFYTTRSSGSGLGLAVVHRAVEAHDGAVLVESPPGGGAEFVIYLPGRARASVASGRKT